jgi:hypothetical protein
MAGLRGAKPFECTGTGDEVRVAAIGNAAAKQWAHFARISADKRVLLSAMIAARGFLCWRGEIEIAE